ncbi:MAG TPA: hypothetical protein PKY29_01055 [Ferruginibacter sp.]|nr:hypothetical protein [Ferruginibacter sp.]HRQ19867.1 hypothetical protein [Ferruginibacter sp.]
MEYLYAGISGMISKSTRICIISLLLFCAQTSWAQGPDITYTPLPDGCGSAPRTLTVTITDPDGVPVSGAGLPVLYYRINAGAYIPITATYPGSGNDYTFTGVGAGGFVGAIIYYYIAAQDNLGNVTITPGTGAGGITANPPAASTPPSNADFYVIKNLLAAGTYTVGTPASDFLTLTDAVNTYNNSCLNGHVVFNIMKTVYLTGDDNFPITINYNPQAAPSRTLTIKPNTSVTYIVNEPEAMFRLNGAEYVILDGSRNGTNTRDVTFDQQNNTGSEAIVWLTSTATKGARYNTIKNMKLSGQGRTGSFAGIVSSGGNSKTDPAEHPNSYNLFENNEFRKSYYGILLNGGMVNDVNNVFRRNQFTSGNSTGIGFRGISASNQTGLLIDTNKVQWVKAIDTIGTDIRPPAGICLEGNILNATISRNEIYEIRNDDFIIGCAVYGIAIMPDNNNNNIRIFNNMISRTLGRGNATNVALNGHGIALLSGTGHRLWYNTISQPTNQVNSGITSCLYIGPGISTANAVTDVRNNIFSNRISTGARYGVYVENPTNLIFGNINFNNYYSAGSQGFLGGARASLAAWQSATGQDASSVSANPQFLAATDLHVNGNSPMNALGTPIPGITTDKDGDARDVLTPDIGADEFSPPPCTENNAGTVTVNTNSICVSGAPVLFATGYSFGFGITYQWEMSSDNVTFVSIPGQDNPVTATSTNINTTTYYRLRVNCLAGAPGYSNVVSVNVFNPGFISTSTSATRCGLGTVSLNATPTTGASVRWYDVPANGAVLGTVPNFTTPPISSNTTFYVESFQGGTTGTAGPVSPSAQGGTIQKGQTSWQVYFNVNTPTKLLSVDIFPYGAGEISTLTVRRADHSIVASIPYTTTVSGGSTPQTIPINVQLPVGIGYYIWSNAYEDFPISGLARNSSGGAYPYPVSPTSQLQITGNEFNANSFMYYYRWRFSNACESPRTPIPVTVTTPPPVVATATPTSVCSGNPVTLSASSPNVNYIYSWSPSGGPGATVTVSPTAFTTYTVTANDGVCANKVSVDVAMNAMPEEVFASADVTKCEDGAPVALSVSGGITRGDPLLFENFNSADDPPAGWVKSVNGSTGISGRFTKRPDAYSPGAFILRSNDQSQFYLTDAQAAVTHSSLRTPSMNFSGFATVNMTFWHHYRAFISDTIFVEISTVPSPSGNHDYNVVQSEWTTLVSYTTFAQGGPTSFKKVELDLTPWVGNPTVYIRFRMKSITPGEEAFYWAIDNLFISGDDLAPTYTWSPVAGLFEDAAGTIPYTAGTALNTVYAQPLVTTDYIAASTAPNGCMSRDTTKVSIFPVGGVLSGDNVICLGGSSNLTVTLTGTGPWSVNYSDGTNTFTESGITTSTHIIPVSPLVNTTYTLVSVTDANCTATGSTVSGSATINLTSVGISSWLGNSTDWFDQNNWCGLVPDGNTDVIIPSGLSFYPIIDGDAAVKNISLALNATLTVDPGSRISISENATIDGALNINGELRLNGNTAQTFPLGNGTVTPIPFFTIENSGGGVTIAKDLVILDEMRPNAGTITLADTITIRSNLTKTARINAVGPTVQFVYTTGRFIVERYIPEHPKAWALLSAATFGQTVKQAWQEGAVLPLENPKPGYGTIMTSNLPSALVQGFDFFTPLGNTVTIYNPATNRWDGIPSTTTEPVSQPQGYMIYVRGDRSVQDAFTPATDVILRSTGKIYSPTDPPASIPVPANRFQSVGNPYASSIDFQQVQAASSGVDLKFYVWDHQLFGYSNNGGWQTISSANGWRPVPGSAGYPAATPVTRIQSGQAFMVFSTGGGTVQFGEQVKVTGEDNVLRTADLRLRKYLRASLHSAGGMADGNLIVIDGAFSNAIDADDAMKIIAGGPQFGLRNNNIRLALEARKLFRHTDTVYYDIRNLVNGSHRIEFEPENMPGSMQAWLVDVFLGTETPVRMDAPSSYAFEVTSQPGSKAANRFHLIFELSRPEPTMITRLQAEAIREGILVNWTVEHENNVSRYVVEHSTDRSTFSDIGGVAANGTQQVAAYHQLHTLPTPGINYYRLRIYDNNGAFTYSDIVSAMWNEKIQPMIVVYPNPVTGESFKVTFTNIPAGKYGLMLVNTQGKEMHREQLMHTVPDHVYTIRPRRRLAAGSYYLIITGEAFREKRLILVQ